MTNAEEGPAYGAALLAGVGTGVWSGVEEACRATIRRTSSVAVRPKQAKQYERHYDVYRKLYGDLKERFTEMAQLS